MMPSPSDTDPSTVAPGPCFGRRRVGVLLAVMFCYLFYYTGRQTFGFAIPGIQAEFGLNKAQLGWCGAAMLWSYAIGQAITGQMADRWGGRGLMACGGMLSAVLNWVVSFGSGLLSIGIPWGLNGFAQSLGFASGSRILSNWWDHRHRGVIYGAYVFAAGCASILAFVMATWMVGFGWRWVFRWPVLFLFAVSGLFYFLVRDKPSDCGLADLPEDDPSPPDGPAAQPIIETALDRYRKVLRSGSFLLACASIGCQNLARYGLYVWVPVHFLGSKLQDSPDKWISLWLPVGMAVGAMTNGWISDHLLRGNRSRAALLFLIGAGLAAAAMWWLPKGHPLVVPMLFLTGFFVYGPESAYWALCPDLLGRRLAGTGTGVMNFCAKTVAGLGEPTVGALIERTGQTGMIFAVVSVACFLGAGLMGLVRR